MVISRPTGGGQAPNYTASLNLMVKVLDFVKSGGFDCPDYLLPAAFTPALKRTVDNLADWP